MRRTELDTKHMRPVIRFDEDDLVLVCVVQGPRLVLLDGEVEDRLVHLHLSDEVRVLAIVGSDDIRPSEAELRVSASWQENGAVVD